MSLKALETGCLNLFEFSAKQQKRNEQYQVWTHENHPELIYSDKFILQKLTIYTTILYVPELLKILKTIFIQVQELLLVKIVYLML